MEDMSKEINTKDNSNINRTFIDELGIKFEDTPQGWCSTSEEACSREEMWQRQRDEWGFDERETWSLDYTFKLWLYERLKVYNEINTVDTTYNKFKFNGELITLQDCLDRMINGLEKVLKYREDTSHGPGKDTMDDVLNIFTLCFGGLWW